MNPTTVIKEARNYFQQVFENEQIENIGLEEVVFDDEEHLWRVTFGFFRPWDHPPSSLWPDPKNNQRSRQYKVVMLDEMGNPKGITIRNDQNN